MQKYIQGVTVQHENLQLMCVTNTKNLFETNVTLGLSEDMCKQTELTCNQIFVSSYIIHYRLQSWSDVSNFRYTLDKLKICHAELQKVRIEHAKPDSQS